MRKYYFTFLLLLALGIVSGTATGFVSEALAVAGPKAAVVLLNEGIERSKKEPDALMGAIRQVFDLKSIAVASIGRQRWRQWSKQEREDYIKAFTTYFLAVYRHRFRDHEGEGLEIYKEQAEKNRALVYTRIFRESDEGTITRDGFTNIDFLLFKRRRDGRERWLIRDVYFKGTISEVAGFRAQFSPVLEEGGRIGLIREMKKKCEFLANYCDSDSSVWR